MSNADTVLKKIKDEDVKFVDLRFTDRAASGST